MVHLGHAGEPDSEHFFMTAKRAGGPVYPHSAFKEIYNELYLEKKEESKEKEQPADQSAPAESEVADGEKQSNTSKVAPDLDRLKQTEYKTHPMYTILMEFSDDLRDFIEDKRTQYL